MKLVKNASIVIFAISCLVFVIIKTTTYQISVQNFKLNNDLAELVTNNDELKIQLTTNLSRTELMEKYPNLELYDNIFYIEEEE